MDTRPRRFPLPLIARSQPESPVAYLLPSLPEAGVAVSFTVDDKFHSHSKVAATSLAARGLWVSAGTWSSDHRKGGVVPDRVLATLGCTPELETELLNAGLWKRVRRGIRFHDWEQWNDTPEKAAERDAEAERKRELARDRQNRKRARDREGGLEVQAPVTRDRERDVTRPGRATRKKPQASGASVTRDAASQSRSLERDVTRPEYKPDEKQQVNGTPVTRDISVTSRSSRAPARDFDFDFNQREENQVSQSGVVNARAREDDPPPGSPAFRLQVIAAFAGATPTRVEIDDATADALADEVLGKATAPVPFPLGYVLKAIDDERDPCGRWLPRRLAASPSRPARPEWCGECGQEDRMLEVIEDGKLRLKRCPKCSGHAAAWEKNAS